MVALDRRICLSADSSISPAYSAAASYDHHCAKGLPLWLFSKEVDCAPCAYKGAVVSDQERGLHILCLSPLYIHARFDKLSLREILLVLARA